MAEALPAELERRIEVLERAGETRDLDTRSWVWLILLGAVLPALLLALGWWL
jgi:hypothetical protein